MKSELIEIKNNFSLSLLNLYTHDIEAILQRVVPANLLFVVAANCAELREKTRTKRHQVKFQTGGIPYEEVSDTLRSRNCLNCAREIV